MLIGAFAWSAERAGMPETRVVLPREEWISLIPGAHPGYITLEQYDANCARLTANAAAHGRDRRSGPPREATALLQGIICGRCGLRMTVRYHRRGRSQSREVPTYMCQRDGIENGRQACAAIPGEGLDRAIGQLLIDVGQRTARSTPRRGPRSDAEPAPGPSREPRSLPPARRTPLACPGPSWTCGSQPGTTTYRHPHDKAISEAAANLTRSSALIRSPGRTSINQEPARVTARKSGM
jgi:hypothetical protein